ncbi:MAG: GldG family protein [Bdellovibrionales bacterium]
MSKMAKICFLGAFLLAVAAVVIQFMTGVWINLNSVLLGLSAGLVVLAIVLDWKLYWEFLTMRTTKHGMNMGALILLVIALLVCVNYLANKHNKTWDLTQERLNSLSDQTTKVLDQLKSDLEVKVFYKGAEAQEERQRVKQSLDMYQDASSKVKIHFINAYVDQQLALQYLNDLPDRDNAALFVFVEHDGKRIRAEQPFDEASITSAMIKATREGQSKVYFLTGHGEKDMESSEDQGLKEFVSALKEASYVVESLNLIDRKEIPQDASVVAIIGPSVPYLDAELDWLRGYVQRGGRLFVALDPGQRHNLANLTKTLGVQFENNFVITMAPIVGGGPATILGRTFEPGSDITKNFPSGSSFAVFPLVSQVSPASDRPPSIEVKELVRSDQYAFTMTDLSTPVRQKPDTKAVTVGVLTKGKVQGLESSADTEAEGGAAKEKQPKKEGAEEKSTAETAEKADSAKEFEAVVFGDSDFVSNRALMLGVNRDLALNAIAELTAQKDLLSIRPKMPKGTMVTLTQAARWGVLIGGLSIPVLLLMAAGVMWFRRRSA